MIALIESGDYSDFTVEIVHIDEPWEAWAWARATGNDRFTDGKSVTHLVRGECVWSREKHSVDDIKRLWLSHSEPYATEAWGDAERVVAKTWPNGDVDYALTPAGARTVLDRARAAIEAECAAKGEPVPWEGVKP